MSADPDDPALIALGAAISEGAPIDWREAERTAGGEDGQRLVLGLRDLAALVAAHRSAGQPDEPVAHAEAPVSPRSWRHLVLFESIGEGAFGSVYRGWDPQLEREVAVKLLRKSSPGAGSPLAEARHLASVRHVNVVTIHGADQDDHQVGIWMDYIEGQTLAAMIRDAGPMSAREMAGIGIDLCRALSALHAAGLLHRDIKAHNVMREVGGRIVLMDFSGAQPLEAGADPQVFSGTPLYMAPELFEGGGASIVSDVYSLGVLLFFLLTGTVPVDGATLAEVRRAHLARTRKDLRSLRPDLTDSVAQVIERATEHDAAARYRTAGELERALATASGAPTLIDAGAPPAARLAAGPSRSPGRGAGVLVAGVMIVSLMGWAGADRWKPTTPVAPTAHFTVGPPYNSGSWPRLSPDGRQVVFGATVEGRNRFWLRPLDGIDGRALMATTATETPFWSPDSRTLAFFADQKLKRISTDGGAPETIADVPHPRGGDWLGDWIVFSTTRGIARVSPDGSHLQALTTLDQSQGDYQHGWPRFLPDGHRFLYIIRSSKPERAGVWIGSTDGEAPIRLMPAYSRVTYAGGNLLYVREGTLFAQPFDLDSATIVGAAVPLAGRVKAHLGGDAAFDVSATGVLIYCLDSGQPQTRLMLLDRRGREIQALTDVGAHRAPRFSPDGQRVVAETATTDDNYDVWLYGVARQSAVRLTKNDAPDVKPVWSADGARVIFSARRAGTYRVFSEMVDGTGSEEPVETPPGDVYVEHWSRDGRYLLATILRSGLWVIPLAPGQRPWQVRADARASTWQSEFSPDGRWLAYMSEESGQPEVYVEPFPATGARWQVSARGGAEPHWTGNSTDLFYLAADGILMTTKIGVPDWQNARPVALFRISVPELTGNSDYTVSPDGEYFVINTFVADPLVPPIDVVVNWTALMKK